MASTSIQQSNNDVYPRFAVDNCMMPPSDTSDCLHIYCEMWGEILIYIDCRPAMEVTELNCPNVYHKEMEKKSELGATDFSSPEDSVSRGVTLQFLVDLCCNEYNLLNVSTRKVRREYVIPMTSEKRCRFVDLPVMRRRGIVGVSSTFISHYWDAKFGDLVAAACDGAIEYSRRVWVDVFAVRQWPSTKDDLNF